MMSFSKASRLLNLGGNSFVCPGNYSIASRKDVISIRIDSLVG